MGSIVAKHKKDIIAVLLLLIWITVFYSMTYDRSQYNWITRAHEGLSFSSAVRVNQGLIPQRDFTYSYGPVMPYVFAAVFKVFGASLAVLRASWAILFAISILLFYWTGRRFLPPFLAFAAAAMVIGQQHTPLYTYNHVGLVLAIQVMFLAVLKLLEERSRLWSVLFSVAFLSALLIKFNEALVVFLALLLGIWFFQLLNRRGHGAEVPLAGATVKSLAWLSGIPVALFMVVTIALNAGLSKSEFLRNFPMLPQYQANVGGYRFVWNMFAVPFKVGLIRLSGWRWYTLWYENYFFPVVLSFIVGACCLVFLGFIVFSKRFRENLGAIALPAVLLVAIAFSMYHEFYLTGNHWSTEMYVGFPLLALVFLITKAMRSFPRMGLSLVTGLLLFCLASDVVYAVVARRFFSQSYFDMAGMRIYSSTTSDGLVIRDVVDFLQHSVPAGSEIAAFPHDALLIHLAGQKNALRDDSYQWMLFPSQQSDAELVDEIQARHVSRVFISNFIGVHGAKIVFFGKDYLPQTYQFLQTHYHKTRSFAAKGSTYKVDYFEINSAPVPPPVISSRNEGAR